MTTSARTTLFFRADVVIGPYRQVFDKLDFAERHAGRSLRRRMI